MIQTPKGLRLCLGIYGRRNVGKSSLLNTMTRQEVSIVSDVPGTTTDPVEKAMELLPLGPVLWIDTAGIDDVGDLGGMRIERTRKIMERTDIALLVTDGVWGDFEQQLWDLFTERNVPVIILLNKSDLNHPPLILPDGSTSLSFSALHKQGVAELIAALIQKAPEGFMTNRPIVGDIVPADALVLLVVPIDLEAPRGRLILPQVQTIRDILDHHCQCLITQDDGVKTALDRLREPPALVVCDSQVFHSVNAQLPPEQLLTSFSILFARLKGDLNAFIEGAKTIAELREGDSVLIAEACSHHPVGEDIGRVKIPALLRQKCGGALNIVHTQGSDFPDLLPFKLVIHCGACTFNAQQMLFRIARCAQAGVPITNYGMTLAACAGILNRALEPFSRSHE